MLDYNEIKNLLYKYPNASDSEIADKLIEKNPDLLNEYQKDTIRRKISFIRELPLDFSYIPAEVFDVAIERFLLEKKIVKRKEIKALFRCSDEILDTALKKMRKLGYNIEENEYLIELKPIVREVEKITIDNYDNGLIRFGALADTHLGSIFERLDLLHTLYDIFEKEGINVVFHCGNYIDGESRINRNELYVRGLDGQVDYFVRNYPYKPNITTYFISGDDHEGWWQREMGFRNIGYYVQLMREKLGMNDLKYIGYLEQDIELKRKDTGKTAILRVAHMGGGSAYAISYTPQKIIESYINFKPNILLLGHYHKAETGWYRNVFYAQVGCLQDQTTYMRKLKLQAVLGGFIFEAHQAPDGSINYVKSIFYPFFDKKYYQINNFYVKNSAVNPPKVVLENV
ncbi:MAG: metallophosphoesterase [Candidatus Omnitrophica bacterium]|nr:metallophosphoesterase [Candidatus Omnitrophota bacterium]